MPQTEGTRVPAAAAIPIHEALTPRAETGGNRFVTRYDAIASHPIPSQTGHGLVALPRSSAGERASTEHVEQAPRVRRLLTRTHTHTCARRHTDGRTHAPRTQTRTHALARTCAAKYTHTCLRYRTRARAHTHTQRHAAGFANRLASYAQLGYEIVGMGYKIGTDEAVAGWSHQARAHSREHTRSGMDANRYNSPHHRTVMMSEAPDWKNIAGFGCATSTNGRCSHAIPRPLPLNTLLLPPPAP